jgi:hypothetical protein
MAGSSPSSSSASSFRRFRVVQVQPTPNPNAAKFLLDRAISEQPMSFLTAAVGAGNPLASKLFAIPGVSSLLFLGDFITVNKTPEASWKDVTAGVKQVLASGA